MRAGPRALLAAATLLSGLLAPDHAAAGLGPEEAILPTASHATAETRMLAETHADELRRLYAEFRRCHPDLGLERHGIAFRRPRGAGAGSASLTVWAWLDSDPPPGADLRARAVYAFGRHGHALFRRLVARSRVFGDSRVSGYGVVLSWFRPTAGERGTMVGESLAVFSGKLDAANFVHETIAAAVFLERTEVRVFDGQTEVAPPRLAVDDARARAATAC
jgi:hypothetical protein